MLDFILSKLNMLILVTALFAIGTYFAFYLGQSLEQQQSNTVLSRVIEDVFGVVGSSSICHQVNLTLPPFINTLGRTDTGNKLYYLFRVQRLENVEAVDVSGRPVNSVIFSIRDKKDGTILAAQSINTIANIMLFEWDSEATGSDPVSIASPQTDGSVFVEMNPQAVSPENAVMIVKEVYNGQPTLFIIPCSTYVRFQCETNLGAAVQLITASRSDARFNCIE